MPDINTAPFRNIILEALPAVDRNATPLPGMEPNTFLASLTAVLSAGGWPGPHPTAATSTGTATATAATSGPVSDIPQTKAVASTPTPTPTFTSPLAPGASHAYKSNATVDIFSVLFGQSGAGG